MNKQRTWKDEMDGKYQRDVSDFVGREVIYCVSSLMDEMFKNEKCQDELLETFVVNDYEEALLQAGFKQEIGPYGEMVWRDTKDNTTWAGSAETVFEHLGDIDPYEREIFEYWIVSGWLGEKLQAKGEAVLMDHEFLPTPIWGRTTTGQGIAGDEVIMDIYDELHKA